MMVVANREEQRLGNPKSRVGAHAVHADGHGILRLAPAWVARDLTPPGKRLGLRKAQYDVGERSYPVVGSKGSSISRSTRQNAVWLFCVGSLRSLMDRSRAAGREGNNACA